MMSAEPRELTRPGPRGFLDTIGIVSIVVGAVSMLIGFSVAASWWAGYRQSAAPPGQLARYSTSFRPLLPGDPKLMRTLAMFTAGSQAVSLLLIAAGVLTLIRARLGLKCHFYFAVLKIVCICVGIVLTMAYLRSVKAIYSNPRNHYSVEDGTTDLIVSVFLQLIYPVVVASRTGYPIRLVSSSRAARSFKFRRKNAAYPSGELIKIWREIA